MHRVSEGIDKQKYERKHSEKRKKKENITIKNMIKS